jgi:hypothetical protein
MAGCGWVARGWKGDEACGAKGRGTGGCGGSRGHGAAAPERRRAARRGLGRGRVVA